MGRLVVGTDGLVGGRGYESKKTGPLAGRGGRYQMSRASKRRWVEKARVGCLFVYSQMESQ